MYMIIISIINFIYIIKVKIKKTPDGFELMTCEFKVNTHSNQVTIIEKRGKCKNCGRFHSLF